MSPFPGGTPANISCTAGGAVINEGDTLAADTPCTGTFKVTIPNDRTLCGTPCSTEWISRSDTPLPGAVDGRRVRDGDHAHRCPADITITKTADALSKVGDPVTYTFEICNVGDILVNRGSVTDTLLGDLTEFFPATLAPDQCVTVVRTRTVLAGDPDPLPNTVTATYSAGPSLGHGYGQCQHEPVPARCRCHQDLHAESRRRG